jgi:phage shock protein C
MKRLVRSQTDRMIAGICGGIAQTYNWDPTIVRLGVVALAMVTGILPMTGLYIVGWIIIPDKSKKPQAEQLSSVPPE